jgi:hypothetical protein
MAELKKDPLAPLITLRAAAAKAYIAATRKTTTDTRKLNDLARIVADRVPVFTRGTVKPARVLPDEIKKGRFEKGGAQLCFLDGRPPITHLSILQSQLPIAIAAVRNVYGSDSG